MTDSDVVVKVKGSKSSLIDRLFRNPNTGSIDNQDSVYRTIINPDKDSMYNPENILKILNPDKDISKETKASDITRYLDHNRLTNAGIAEDNDNLLRLSPELKQAAKLIRSSILSPDDLQDSSLRFITDNKVLSDETNTKISEMITSHICEERKLNRYLPDWLYSILVQKGSQPIVVIPAENNRTLQELSLAEKVVHQQNTRRSLNEDQFDTLFEQNLFGSDKKVSFQSVSSLVKLNDDMSDYVTALDEAFPNIKEPFDSESIKKSLIPMLNAMTEDKKVVVADNYRALRVGKKALEKAKQRINDIVGDHFNGKDKGMFRIGAGKEIEEGDLPILLPLDGSSIIPVTIPGTTESVGYFGLFGAQGSPLTVDMLKSHDVGSSVKTSAARITEIAFSGTGVNSKLNDQDKNRYATTIFNIALKQILETKLKDIGITGAKLGEHNTIARFIFQNFLHGNKVRVVFIPEALMVYLALEYRADGTGKSRLEDGARLRLSLKNTLIVAEVMQAADAAMEHSKIEVDVPEDEENVLGLLDDIRSVVTTKKSFKPTPEYGDISRDIVNQHFTIAPKNIPGIKGLTNISAVRKSNSSPSNYSELRKELDMGSAHDLGVPAHAMNLLNQAEFRASVVTNNLFMSNNVKNDQKALCEGLTKLGALLVGYNYELREKIKILISTDSVVCKDIIDVGEKILNKQDKDIETKGAFNVTDLGVQLKTKDEVIDTILKHTIGSIKAYLPPPTIVVDKAQYEELDKAVDIVEKVVNFKFNADLIGIEDKDRENEAVLKTIRAAIKKHIINGFINNQGYGKLFNFDIDNYNPATLTDFNLIIENAKRALKGQTALFDSALASGEDSSGGSSWG
ncbi:MAG: hypothetical protein GY804_09475 [Alphaproteobacteria bacterium]|nr:hypothetical protein [Alphaproteobacteria bacterium]